MSKRAPLSIFVDNDGTITYEEIADFRPPILLKLGFKFISILHRFDRFKEMVDEYTDNTIVEYSDGAKGYMQVNDHSVVMRLIEEQGTILVVF